MNVRAKMGDYYATARARSRTALSALIHAWADFTRLDLTAGNITGFGVPADTIPLVSLGNDQVDNDRRLGPVHRHQRRRQLRPGRAAQRRRRSRRHRGHPGHRRGRRPAHLRRRLRRRERRRRLRPGRDLHRPRPAQRRGQRFRDLRPRASPTSTARTRTSSAGTRSGTTRPARSARSSRGTSWRIRTRTPASGPSRRSSCGSRTTASRTTAATGRPRWIAGTSNYHGNYPPARRLPFKDLVNLTAGLHADALPGHDAPRSVTPIRGTRSVRSWRRSTCSRRRSPRSPASARRAVPGSNAGVNEIVPGNPTYHLGRYLDFTTSTYSDADVVVQPRPDQGRRHLA
ncbi:MAG: hypothetical protein MZV65_29050 [Chromatiales bacterium]|nr:hypothetical protein [Chromatiales bacterium]